MMKFELWKIIRNSTYLIIYLLILSLIDSFSGSDVGFTGLFFGVPFLIYWFSFKFLRIRILSIMFFPISLIFLGGSSRIPKCNRCNKLLYHNGNSLHEVYQSKGPLFRFISTKVYDVKSAQQIRCYNPSCFPKNEIFQTPYKKDYVFLRKDSMLKKFYQDKHLIINLDSLDLNLHKSQTEKV
jgi:hypothetical protein